MKTQIITYPKIEEMDLPQSLSLIEIPTFDKIVEPVTAFAKAQGDEDAESIEGLARRALDVYIQQQITNRYFGEILPWIRRKIYAETQLEMDADEEAAYIKQYLSNVEKLAEERGLTFEAYGKDVMHLQEPIKEAFVKQAKEDFVFKALAHHLIEEKPDALAYDAFIQQQVMQVGADEIGLRASFSYDDFCQSYPEMLLLEQIGEWVTPQLEVSERADVEFKF